jgi:hypothetical protein
MVSYGESELELTSEGVDEGGLVVATVRVMLPCGECGAELKDNEFEFSIDTNHQCEIGKVKCTLCGHPLNSHKDGKGCSFELTKPTPENPVPDVCQCLQYEESEVTEFEMEMEEPEGTEDYRPKTQKKKGVDVPVPMRYQKHYFGAKVSGTLTCNRCGEEITFEDSQDVQSSAFNELV